jgi:hypothetical protein
MPGKELSMSKLSSFFNKNVQVINIGIPSFAEDLTRQGVANIHVDWRPPAGGNRKIQALLEKINSWQEKVRAAKEGK